MLRVVTSSQKTLKITVPTAAGTYRPTDPLRLKTDMRIRQVSINAEGHDIDREVTVRCGQHTLIDHLPDLQSYSTAAIERPENAPQVGQSEEITAEVYVPAAGVPAANVVYLVTIDYWVVIE